MKYIERPDLPNVIIDAIKDPYYARELGEYLGRVKTKANGRFISSTTLPTPPRSRILRERYDDRIIIDPVDGNFWKLLGNTVHNILEHHSRPNDIVEHRIGIDMPVRIGKRTVTAHVHCKPDILVWQEYSGGKSIYQMHDYKLTSVYAVMRGEKFEHHAQLNVNRYLALRAYPNIEIPVIGNLFLFRDYKPSMYKEGGDYPKSHAVFVEVPIWSDEKVEEYISERATMHFGSESLSDERLPLCSESERWVDPTFYKVFKKDKDGRPQFRSKFRSESMVEVTEWMNRDENAFERAKDPATKKVIPDKADLSRPIDYEVKEVLGKSGRCAYCEAARFCNQRQAELARIAAEGGGDEGEEQ